MAKNILEEAIEDVKALQKAAESNAKYLLVEALSPSVKKMIQKEMAQVAEMAYEAVDAEENGGEQAPESDVDEGGMYEAEHGTSGIDVDDQKDMEDDEDDEDEKGENEAMNFEAKATTVNPDEDLEMKEAKEEDDDKEEMEESVEISEADLRKALADALGLRLSEADVTKGFGDVEDPNPGSDETGLLDKDKSEKQWKDVKVPAAKDWTVKEANYRKQVKALQKEVSLYKEAISYLKNHVNEVHVFNSKLVHTNKLLHKTSLTEAQKLAIIEAFDGAKTKREVELVFKSLSESLKIAGVVTEGRKMPTSSKVAKSSKFTTPSSTLLKEGAQRESAPDANLSRVLELAGLVD